MRIPPPMLPALLLAASVAGGALHADQTGERGRPSRPPVKPTDPVVTPVAGPSWLNHLNIPYAQTSLGRGTGQYGPPPGEPPKAAPKSSFAAGQPAVLT